ncbi:MAG: hypothetical protein JRI43_01440 [Deltaproteobacteria bacterium]|nr:hypothetical protein [Deltaproteobacteria bacterium]
MIYTVEQWIKLTSSVQGSIEYKLILEDLKKYWIALKTKNNVQIIILKSLLTVKLKMLISGRALDYQKIKEPVDTLLLELPNSDKSPLLSSITSRIPHSGRKPPTIPTIKKYPPPPKRKAPPPPNTPLKTWNYDQGVMIDTHASSEPGYDEARNGACRAFAYKWLSIIMNQQTVYTPSNTQFRETEMKKSTTVKECVRAFRAYSLAGGSAGFGTHDTIMQGNAQMMKILKISSQKKTAHSNLGATVNYLKSNSTNRRGFLISMDWLYYKDLGYTVVEGWMSHALAAAFIPAPYAKEVLFFFFDPNEGEWRNDEQAVKKNMRGYYRNKYYRQARERLGSGPGTKSYTWFEVQVQSVSKYQQ